MKEKEGMHLYTVQLPVALYTKAEKHARSEGTSLAAIVRASLIRYLRDKEMEKNEK